MGFLGSLLGDALKKVAGDAIKKVAGESLGKAIENVIKTNAGNPGSAATTTPKSVDEVLFDFQVKQRKVDAENAAAQVVTPTSPADVAVIQNFKQLLPQYPAWTVGGSNFQLEKGSELRQGLPIYTLTLTGQPQLLDGYCLLLERNGFAKPCKDEFSDLYYKVVDGLCYCFSCTDACQDNSIWVGFYVDNSVLNK